MREVHRNHTTHQHTPKESPMLARIRKSLDENQKGFTLVELLVVVIIIGILAAIATPVFLGQQAKAMDSTAKADLANSKTAVVAKFVETPTLTLAEAQAVVTPVKSEKTTSLTVKSFSASNGTFCIEATSGSTKIFSVKETGSLTQAAC
jgi:prepilin-type N-terminal cleavage/methylation domain-containing protein